MNTPSVPEQNRSFASVYILLPIRKFLDLGPAILFCIFFVLLSLINPYRLYSLKQNGAMVNGNVVDFVRNGRTECPVIQFYFGSKEHRFTSRECSSIPPKIGDRVDVIFDPKNLQEAQLASYGFSFRSILFAIALLAIVIYVKKFRKST